MYFFQFYSNSQLMAEISVFLWRIKLKQQIKSKKYAGFGRKLGKLASNLKMSITKMEKKCSNMKNLWSFLLFNPDFNENNHKFFQFYCFSNFPDLSWNLRIFLILFVKFPDYGWNWLIFLMNQTKKMNKIKKTLLFQPNCRN